MVNPSKDAIQYFHITTKNKISVSCLTRHLIMCRLRLIERKSTVADLEKALEMGLPTELQIRAEELLNELSQ